MQIDLDFILNCFLTTVMLYFFLNMFFRFQKLLSLRDSVFLLVLIVSSIMQLGASRNFVFYIFIVVVFVIYVITHVVYNNRWYVVLTQQGTIRQACKNHPHIDWKRKCKICFIVREDNSVSISKFEKGITYPPFRFRFRQLIAFYLVITFIIVLWRF